MSTLSVVVNKMEPVASVPITPTVIVTAQYFAGQFEEFSAESAVAGHSMRDIIAATVRCSLPAEVAEVKLASTGLIEGTRTKDADGKPKDGDRTAAARKFCAMVQSIYGAIRFAGMSEKELDGFASAQAMYDSSREYRKAAGEIDWQGNTAAEKAAKKAKKAKAAAVGEAADEAGLSTDDLLTIEPEALKALQEAAKVKLQAKAAQDKLAAMEKRAGKLAKDLIQSFGWDDAETCLKRALEMIATGAIPQ